MGRESGTALVIVARGVTPAGLRIRPRFLAEGYRWVSGPVGDPALPSDATIEVRVDALGWKARATITLPCVPYGLRLSACPDLPDRRGGEHVRRSVSLAWEDYVLCDSEQLVFLANRLMTTVCAELRSWGEAARTIRLGLTLADRTVLGRLLRTSRATVDRTVWMRLVRRALERIRPADGVVILSLTVDTASRSEAPQGDVFDRGFQTAHAVQGALARLEDDSHATLVELVTSAHPLSERRFQWKARTLEERAPTTDAWSRAPRLVLRLFPEPLRVEVATARRNGHWMPEGWWD